MARTPHQRRWADASTADQLEYIGLLVALVIVFADIVFGGLFLFWVVFPAALYVFIVGCFRAATTAGTYFR